MVLVTRMTIPILAIQLYSNHERERELEGELEWGGWEEREE